MPEKWKKIQRKDYKIIIDLIEKKSKVLDIGCSDGELLYQLKKTKNCKIQGIEINFDFIVEGVKKGIPIIQHNIELGLPQIPDNFYDYVILSQTLQVLLKPAEVLKEVLRIGKRAIISFPNFGHYQIRFYLLFKGLMPKSKVLPFEWYNTPNIHLITVKDFKKFCKEEKIKILKEIYFSEEGIIHKKLANKIPNLFAEYGIYLLEKR